MCCNELESQLVLNMILSSYFYLLPHPDLHTLAFPSHHLLLFFHTLVLFQYQIFCSFVMCILSVLSMDSSEIPLKLATRLTIDLFTIGSTTNPSGFYNSANKIITELVQNSKKYSTTKSFGRSKGFYFVWSYHTEQLGLLTVFSSDLFPYEVVPTTFFQLCLLVFNTSKSDPYPLTCISWVTPLVTTGKILRVGVLYLMK